MAFIIIHHRVKNVAAWKPYFDGDLKRQQEAGLKVLKTGTKADDPNDVYIVFESKDPSKFKAMVSDPGLKEVMDKGGVISAPEFFVINDI
jgi:hypothetical protein